MALEQMRTCVPRRFHVINRLRTQSIHTVLVLVTTKYRTATDTPSKVKHFEKNLVQRAVDKKKEEAKLTAD